MEGEYLSFLRTPGNGLPIATGGAVKICETEDGRLWRVDSGGARELAFAEVMPNIRYITTQEEFEQLYNSATWMDAQTVVFDGSIVGAAGFVREGSGLLVPDAVKGIIGINGARIAINEFEKTEKIQAGLLYATVPTNAERYIQNLTVNVRAKYKATFSESIAFKYCSKLTNCIGISTGDGASSNYGFNSCSNLTGCSGTGTGDIGYGFMNCTKLTSCTAAGTGNSGYGFTYCSQLSNCDGSGVGVVSGYGYGFYSCHYASTCRSGNTASTTAAWGGTSTHIDPNTCEGYE